MKVVYTFESIQGMVEHRHPPVETRVAKEKIRALIEDVFIKLGLVESYSITSDEEFPFPFDMPNVMKLDGFFGVNPDYNLVAKEVGKLFEDPKKELKEAEESIEQQLKNASDEEIIKMFKKYHYISSSSDFEERYAEAKKQAKKLLKPYEDISSNLEDLNSNTKREDLVRALNVLNSWQVLSFMKDLNEVNEILRDGKGEEVKEKVMFNYYQWTRKNLAKFYHECGDARFYGAGFWIARLIPTNGRESSGYYDYRPNTLEEALNNMEKPYQIVEV